MKGSWLCALLLVAQCATGFPTHDLKNDLGEFIELAAVVGQPDEADEAAADASAANPAIPTPEQARARAPDAQAVADAETARKLEEQNEKIQALERQYEQTHKRLEKYEKQSSPLSAGTGMTDGSGKTEFIKGYEGGFKVGYEAGWNMATVELQKRYHDTKEETEAPRVPSNVTNALATPLNTTTLSPFQAQPQAQAQAQQPQPQQQPAPVEQPADQTPSAKFKSMFMRQDGQQPQFQNPFANGNNPFANGNNPFFAPREEPQPQPAQQVPVTPAGNLQAQPNPYPNPFPLQAQLVPQQIPTDPSAVGMANFNYNAPSPNYNAVNMMNNAMPQMTLNTPMATGPKTLPQKALNLFNNLKGMLQEGKNTINAVREALRDQSNPMMGQMQPMQQMQPQPFQFQSLVQAENPEAISEQQQMQLLQQQQELMQQQQQQEQPAVPAAADFLSGLANLLQGGATATPPTAANPLDQLGLSNLAQLLATTTGNPAAPKAVVADPAADSEALGIQEMQNMIREG